MDRNLKKLGCLLFFYSMQALPNETRVVSEKTPFTITVRKNKITPGHKKNEKPARPFERISLTVFKSGAPITPRWLNGAQTVEDSASRVLEGCLTLGESNYELQSLKFQKQPIGWLVRRGESCGTTQRYRYRIIALQALYQNTYEIEFSSKSNVVLNENSEGIEFWTLKTQTNSNQPELAPIQVPEVSLLKVSWGKLFEFSRIRLPEDPIRWPELPGFEKTYQSFYLSGLKSLSAKLLEFATEKYFTANDKSIYKAWGLPTSERESNTLIEHIRKLESHVNLNELNNFKL